jgi:hypothetical protein
MRSSALFRVFFILYCAEAGLFLLFAPWSLVWDRTVMQLPLGVLRDLSMQPLLRSALSGFGLVHLVWGLHDLMLLLTAWRSRTSGGLP